jgi:Asp-tRNA(Asn)/Glu-tRNA(Gln) amidotransferase A subunit family amidase
VTTEFANRHPGVTRNPHNPAHTPGGSSSGSAAAVADFQVMVATTTQTGGSTIRPAAFCGIVGYKPTYGHFAPAGMKANTEWLDTIGAYARSVEDIALFRAALMAVPYRPVAKLSKPPRVAVCFTHHRAELSVEGTKAVNDAAAALAKAGAAVSEIELPDMVRDMTAGQQTLSNFDGPRAHADDAVRHFDLLSDSLKTDKLAAGATVDYASWAAARKLGERGRAAVDAMFADFDVILTAPAAGEAPVGLESTGRATFNLLWTYLWMPCITLPFGTGPTGLPVGVQFVGRQHEDPTLLDIAAWARGALS